MREKQNTLKILLKSGLLSGVIALSVSMIGMVGLFSQRDMIAGVLTLGQLLLFASPAAFAYLEAVKISKDDWRKGLLAGLFIGVLSAIPLIILVIISTLVNLRQYFVSVSDTLIQILTFNQDVFLGSILLILVMAFVGLIAAGMRYMPIKYRHPIFQGLIWTFGVSLFSEVLSERVRSFFGSFITKIMFKSRATQPLFAIVLFVFIAGITYWQQGHKSSIKDFIDNQPPKKKRQYQLIFLGIGILILIILPLILGTYLSEVINNVGLYILMGLGLNIVVGFAGLLDLGYVAFFAIGAYTMAVLTSEGALGISAFSFWAALPFCVAASVSAGILLGIPVLRMRGDYLAIVTLGFGEIIRIMANSDLLKPFIGGAQGILQIPKPSIGNIVLFKPGQLYYVILIGVLIAAYISWRLRDSRLGRQWMAMREDEDVAEAMGINLVNTKLLAFAIGAGFSGLSGAIFASKLTSIFPHSFNLLISINVLSLIIVGGLGSIPGVVVGAAILVGLPELLREFKEYRLLMYGGLLIVMMLAKPEGFWPSTIQKRELHAFQESTSGNDT